MGSLAQTPAAIIPHDLKITTLSTAMLRPSEPTERRSMFLSNIDQVVNFTVETVHFFRPNIEHPFDSVVGRLRSALERLLLPYDFLAGRLRFNGGEGRMEIDCNEAGIRFVVAVSGLELAELGELEYPSPAFRQLAPPARVASAVEPDDQLLCAVQVTSFRCGGFALGISTDHSAFDGISFKHFLTNLAALADDKPLAIHPHNNRRLLAARSPPHVDFPHPELVKSAELPASILDATANMLDFKLFTLDAHNITTLKNKAKDEQLDPRAITSFNVVVAHLWRCKALASLNRPNAEKSTILYAVDIRRRISPPLLPGFTGNAVASAYASASYHDLEHGAFSQTVGVIREGASRMSDEYIRSAIDWGEVHGGFPYGDMFVTSWWRLGFAEVEYPWGRPVYSCPVTNQSRDIILLCPRMEGADKGVNVLISLPKEEMEMFESLFFGFLES